MYVTKLKQCSSCELHNLLRITAFSTRKWHLKKKIVFGIIYPSDTKVVTRMLPFPKATTAHTPILATIRPTGFYSGHINPKSSLNCPVVASFVPVDATATQLPKALSVTVVEDDVQNDVVSSTEGGEKNHQ